MMVQPSMRDGIQQSASLHLVEEIGHRVLNEYSEAICSLSLAASSSRSAAVRRQIADAGDLLQAYAQLHRSLLPPPHVERMNLGDYVGSVCRALLTASLARRGVHIALKTDDIYLSSDRCWRIALILTELVRNSARHGFAGGSGTITIEIVGSLGDICCIVRDDGRVLAGKSGGRGQRLVQLIAAELGGLVGWATTPHGMRAQLQISANDLIAL